MVWLRVSITASKTRSDATGNASSEPGRLYVNVHTGVYPGGAVGAQLFRPTEAQDR